MTDRLIQYSSERYQSTIESDTSMLEDKDKELILKAMNKEWTNPKYKLRWFVGQAQITPFSKFRQWLMELRGKEEAIENMEYEIAKYDAQEKKHLWIAENCDNPHEAKEQEVEAWNIRRLQYTTKRRLQDWYLERQQLIDLIKEFEASDEMKLPDGTGRTQWDILNTAEEDKYESEYWTNRLAKQAATDLLFHGRIDGGNMAAIVSMSPGEPTEPLALAFNFSTQLQNTTKLLQEQAEEKFAINGPESTAALSKPELEKLLQKEEPTNKPDDEDIVNVATVRNSFRQ